MPAPRGRVTLHVRAYTREERRDAPARQRGVQRTPDRRHIGALGVTRRCDAGGEEVDREANAEHEVEAVGENDPEGAKWRNDQAGAARAERGR